ncbi:MAG: class I SAM-dependent methyltransferase [Halorhabdus sp.]
MDVPETVNQALADRPVAGRRCLDAGAGVGNTTTGLCKADARTVVAVTNDREHAVTVRERVGPEQRDCRVLEADLRDLPLPDDAVEVVTAHALFNVVPTTDLSTIVGELTRVATPGTHLIVDDYAPVPQEAAIRELFALENAAAELADGRPALTFYPADVLRGVFERYGWRFDRRKTLLDPVPWTENHVDAHASAVQDATAPLANDLGDRLASEADRLAAEIGAESTGQMYSLAFRLPASPE